MQFLSLTKNVLDILLIYQVIHILTDHREVNFSAIKGTKATIKSPLTVILNLVIKKPKNPMYVEAMHLYTHRLPRGKKLPTSV